VKEFTSPDEMTVPALPARIKQRHDIARQTIDSCNVRAFVLVAMEATPGEVFQYGLAAVLLRDDVIDLKG
jgi:hypothetical protein